LDLARMRGAVAARRAYARSFPHLFEPLACAMPLDGAGLRSPWLLGPALLANDVIGFDRNLKVPANARLPRGQLLSGTRLASLLGDQLHLSPRAGAMWWDGIARDTDRLVLEVVLRAASDGAVVANHVQVERVLHTDGRVHGL